MRSVRLVIDANIFVAYAMYGKIERLAEAILTYNLEVFIDRGLLEEIHRTLSKPGMLRSDRFTADDIVELIQAITYLEETSYSYALSPDPEDNFLFDIALQHRCHVIITNETSLLHFKQSPVRIYNLEWFKNNFPV